MSDPKYKHIGSPLTRVVEECGEVLQTIAKVDRFGPSDCHPNRKVNNLDELRAEWRDLNEAYVEYINYVLNDSKKEVRKELKEKLAELAHEQWSGWMQYLFSKGKFNEDGTWTMPAWAVGRWKQQMETPYSKLSENEQDSDRSEADKFIKVIEENSLQSLAREGGGKVVDRYDFESLMEKLEEIRCCLIDVETAVQENTKSRAGELPDTSETTYKNPYSFPDTKSTPSKSEK